MVVRLQRNQNNQHCFSSRRRLQSQSLLDKQNYLNKLLRKHTVEKFLLTVVWVLLLTKIKIFSLVEIFQLVLHLKKQER